MNVQTHTDDESSTWITIGSFDGVHLGHQKILQVLSTRPQHRSINTVAVSFFPHPAVVLGNITSPFYLSTMEEKNALLEKFGAKEIITFTFDKTFSRHSPRDFIILLREKVMFSKLLIGYDFRLGADRTGDQKALIDLGNEMGFSVEVIDPVMFGDRPISSSRIRNALNGGNLKQVNAMLGYPYFVTGRVVHGDGRGKHIGLPTANVQPWAHKLIPAPGVYAAFTQVGQTPHPSVVNVGHRPTFYEKDAVQTIETHILNYSEEIYDRDIKIHFVERQRPEIKFENVNALMAQIKYDIINAKEILSDATKPPNLPA